MGSRTQDECILHFVRMPIEEPYMEDPEHGAKGGIGSGAEEEKENVRYAWQPDSSQSD